MRSDIPYYVPLAEALGESQSTRASLAISGFQSSNNLQLLNESHTLESAR
jgi:hypothetical protein